MAGMIVTWLQKTEKFVIPSALARMRISAVDGAVVSNPIAKNSTCRSGLARASLSASVGEYTIRTSSPLALCSSGLPCAPGTRIMSPNAVNMTSGCLARRQAVVDAPHRQHAHRAPGPMNQLDVRGQDVLEAESVDRVRVPAADLHQAIVPPRVGEAADLVGRPGDDIRVAEFVYVFHADSFSSRP